MKKLFSMLLSLIFRPVYAASKITTIVKQGSNAAGENYNSAAVQFTDAVRIVYSKEIEYHAQPVMRFRQFAVVKNELGVEPGLTISMMTYNNLSMGGALSELVDMQTQALSAAMKSLTVTEYGNAISVSELLLRSSFDDLMGRSTVLLGRDYALVVDCLLRDAAYGTTNTVYAKKTVNGAKVEVTERTGLDSTAVFQVATVKDAIEILDTNNAPKYAGQNWICFVHPHQARTIRDDPHWINASNYGAPEQVFNGEIGRIDDTRFITTTLMLNGAAASTDPAYDSDLIVTIGTGEAAVEVPIYKAVLFGDAYYGLAVSLPVELRDNGVEDFGRKRSLGWYSIMGAGCLHPAYGVVIETA